MAAAAPAGLRLASEMATCMVWSPGTEPAGGSVSIPLNTAEGSGAVVMGWATEAPVFDSLPLRACAAAAVAGVAPEALPVGASGSAAGAVLPAVAPVLADRLGERDGPHAPSGTARRAAPANKARARLRMCRSSTHGRSGPAGGDGPRLRPSREGAMTVERVVEETVEPVSTSELVRMRVQ